MSYLAEVKTRFKLALKHLFPEGVTDRRQLRDMVHIYVMGWCDAMQQADPLQDWLEEVAKPLIGVDWMPDNSWNWW